MPKIPKDLHQKRPYNRFLNYQSGLSLRDPYFNDDLLPWELDEEIPKAITESLRQDIQGLFVLMEHYGIDGKDPNCWILLSLRIAKDYIPGFQMEGASRGTKKKWNYLEKARLYGSVQKIRARNTKFTERSACFHLAAKQGVDGPSLYRRFKEAKIELANRKAKIYQRFEQLALMADKMVEDGKRIQELMSLENNDSGRKRLEELKEELNRSQRSQSDTES